MHPHYSGQTLSAISFDLPPQLIQYGAAPHPTLSVLPEGPSLIHGFIVPTHPSSSNPLSQVLTSRNRSHIALRFVVVLGLILCANTRKSSSVTRLSARVGARGGPRSYVRAGDREDRDDQLRRGAPGTDCAPGAAAKLGLGTLRSGVHAYSFARMHPCSGFARSGARASHPRAPSPPPGAAVELRVVALSHARLLLRASSFLLLDGRSRRASEEGQSLVMWKVWYGSVHLAPPRVTRRGRRREVRMR